MVNNFTLIDYSEYCKKVLLTEENLQDVMNRLKTLYPDEGDFSEYRKITDLFPSIGGKSQMVNFLERTFEERKKANVTPQQTKSVIDEFMAVSRRGARIDINALIKADRTAHPDKAESSLFRGFTELVHQHVARFMAIDRERAAKKSVQIKPVQKPEDDKEILDTKFPDPIYKDDKIEMYEARTPGECYGYEGSSTICLKTPGHFYGSYRGPHQSAFYFIFPRSPETVINSILDPNDPDPHRFLLVEYYLNGRAVWTYENNRMNFVNSLEEIIKKFPVLKAPFQAGKFQQRPFTDTEKANYQLVQQELPDNHFLSLSPEVKDLYISSRHNLSDHVWPHLTPNQKMNYINLSGDRDLTDFQMNDIKKTSALFKRYFAIKRRGLQDKITDGTYLRVGISKHESMVLPELLSGLDENTKKRLVKGMIDMVKNALSGSRLPQNSSLSGIYKLFRGDILSSPLLQSSDLLTSITDILSGVKAVASSWSSVSDNTKSDIYDIAYDLYKANEQTLKQSIMDKIERNQNALLSGLISVPTPHQVEYFNENKQRLLKDKEFSSVLEQNIEQHLAYGTKFPDWLAQFWAENKKLYLKRPNFVKKIRDNLIQSLYGKNTVGNTGFRIEKSFPEGKEVYNMFINDIKKDEDSIRPVVQDVLYDQVMNHSQDPSNISVWDVSQDFKDFCEKNEKNIKAWLAFKLIDDPPEHPREDMVKLINQYREIVLTDPTMKKDLENKLVQDIILSTEGRFHWSGDRIDHWMKNFQNILNARPGMEVALVEKIKNEYGTDRTANAFYTDYGIPLSFYKKHETEILNDPEAYRGLKQKIIDALVWRTPREKSDEDAIATELSPIEKDFVINHGNDIDPKDNLPIITSQKISSENR